MRLADVSYGCRGDCACSVLFGASETHCDGDLGFAKGQKCRGNAKDGLAWKFDDENMARDKISRVRIIDAPRGV